MIFKVILNGFWIILEIFFFVDYLLDRDIFLGEFVREGFYREEIKGEIGLKCGWCYSL